MSRCYIATDPDGGVHLRETASRTYSHAVLVHALHWSDDREYLTEHADYLERVGQSPERVAAARAKAAAATNRRQWLLVGFCGRLDLAQKTADRTLKHRKPGDRVEIAEAVEVSRIHYTAAKKANKEAR